MRSQVSVLNALPASEQHFAGLCSACASNAHDNTEPLSMPTTALFLGGPLADGNLIKDRIYRIEGLFVAAILEIRVESKRQTRNKPRAVKT